MDRSLYVAMSGAAQSWESLSATSHNIANASTVGFKAALTEAAAQQVKGPGLETRVHNQNTGASFDASAGHIMQTDRSLDVALREGNWLAVLDAQGETAYTRAGDLQVDSLGQLKTAGGAPVMGEGGAIAIPPHSKLEIGNDGTISIVPQGGGANQLIALDRLKVDQIPGANLARGADGLFRPDEDAEITPAPGEALVSGALESSNVNLAESLVQMIELQRRFELQVKAMKSADENAQSSARLLRLG